MPYDRQRQDAADDKKNIWFEQTLARQIGLRWVAEALCPTVNEVLLPPKYTSPHAAGDLTAIRGCIYPPVNMTDDDREAYDSQLNELLMQIRQKLTVLVGHKYALPPICFFNITDEILILAKLQEQSFATPD